MQQGVQGDAVPCRSSIGLSTLKASVYSRGAGGLRPPAGARGVPASSLLHSPAAAGGTRRVPE
jgi:hypothetical protein